MTVFLPDLHLSDFSYQSESDDTQELRQQRGQAEGYLTNNMFSSPQSGFSDFDPDDLLTNMFPTSVGVGSSSNPTRIRTGTTVGVGNTSRQRSVATRVPVGVGTSVGKQLRHPCSSTPRPRRRRRQGRITTNGSDSDDEEETSSSTSRPSNRMSQQELRRQ